MDTTGLLALPSQGACSAGLSHRIPNSQTYLDELRSDDQNSVVLSKSIDVQSGAGV